MGEREEISSPPCLDLLLQEHYLGCTDGAFVVHCAYEVHARRPVIALDRRFHCGAEFSLFHLEFGYLTSCYVEYRDLAFASGGEYAETVAPEQLA